MCRPAGLCRPSLSAWLNGELSVSSSRRERFTHHPPLSTVNTSSPAFDQLGIMGTGLIAPTFVMVQIEVVLFTTRSRR